MRHNPCDSHPRPWVRRECACGAFPLVALLSSADSAPNAYASALFARFAGTMRPSAPPQTCTSKLRPLAFFDRPSLPSSVRSEEHTSELQSLRHLVCRLLLEKKNK